MKATSIILLAAILSSGLYIGGCETSHSESNGPGWLGGQKHEETTTTKNPVTGDVSTSHTEQTTH